jgi:uncharacterized small protein (DUF1192 family)
MILDTHEAVEKIVEAGASKKMAEAIVKTLNSSNDNLATKNDLLLTKSELKSDIAAVRSEIAEVKSELKADIAEVRSEIKVLATQFATMKWMQYTILGLLLAPMVAQFLAMYFK